MDGTWRRRDVAACLVLVLATFVTRAQLRADGLFSVDSGILALGVLDFDIASYRPHPPYYVLAVVIGKAFAPWAGPDEALVWAAVLASTATTAGAFALARHLGGPWAASVAGFALLASPLALGNGIVGLSYALEGAAITAVALQAWRTRLDPATGQLVLLACVGAVAVGIRASSALAAAPLLLWAAWPHARRIALLVCVGTAGTLAWVAAALGMGGTWQEFRLGLAYHGRVYYGSDTVADGGLTSLANHGAWFSWALRSERSFLLGGGILLLLLVARRLVLGRMGAGRPPAMGVALLFAWLVPPALFFLLVYAGWPVYPDGYFLHLLPGLVIAVAVAVVHGLRFAGEAAPLAWRVAVVAVALVVAATPLTWFGQWDDRTALVRDVDAWDDSWAGLEQVFPSNQTVLVAAYSNPWVQVEYPEYQAWFLVPYVTEDGLLRFFVQEKEPARGLPQPEFFDVVAGGVALQSHAIPAWVRWIVVVEGHPMDASPSLVVPGGPVGTGQLPSGRLVAVVDAQQVTNVEDVLPWLDVPPAPMNMRLQPPEK